MTPRVFIFAFVFFALVGGASAVITDGLVAYYGYDGNANNYYGNCNGAVTGATSVNNGIIPPSYYFDDNGDHIMTDDSCIQTNDNGTISLWFNKTSITGDDIFWEYGDDTDPNNYFYMWIRNSPPERIYISLYPGSGVYALYFEPGSTVTNGSMHHLVWTSNGSVISAYYDGVKQTLTVASGTNNGDWFSLMAAAEKLSFGEQYEGGVYGNDYVGNIDEVGIWNRSLSDAEVLAVYRNGTIGLTPLQLVPPSITKINFTSDGGALCTWPNNCANTTDTTPTFTLTSDMDATCRISTSDQNYTQMSTQCTQSGNFNTTHSCTWSGSVSSGANAFYFGCNSSLGYTSTDSLSSTHKANLTVWSTTTITQNMPVNNSRFNATATFFNYSISNSLSLSTNCSLKINGVANLTNTSVSTALNNITVSYGVNNWSVNCTDSSGRESTSGVMWFTTDDLTSPVTTVLQWANNSQKNLAATFFNFTFTDNMSIASANITWNGTKTAIPLNNGTVNRTIADNSVYYWNVTVADVAGNVNTTATYVFVEDSTAPTLQAASIPTTGSTGGTITIQINATDNMIAYSSISSAIVEVQSPLGVKTNNSAAAQSGAYNYAASISVPVAGTYTVTNFYLVDTAGNSATISNSTNIAVTDPPASSGGGGGGGGGGSLTIFQSGTSDFLVKPSKIDTYFFYAPFKGELQTKEVRLIASRTLTACSASNDVTFSCAVDATKATVTIKYSDDTQSSDILKADVVLTDDQGKKITVPTTVRVLNIGAYKKVALRGIIGNPYLVKTDGTGNIVGIRYLPPFLILLLGAILWGTSRKVRSIFARIVNR